MDKLLLSRFVLALLILTAVCAPPPLAAQEAETAETTIYTPGRAIEPAAGDFTADIARGGLLIAQFHGEPSDTLLARLRSRGAKVGGYLGGKAYWISAPEGISIPEARAVLRPSASDKIVPALERRLAASAVERMTVTAVFFPGTKTSRVLEVLEVVGGKPSDEGMLYGERMHVELTPEAAGLLAASDLVTALEPGPRTRILLNRGASKQTGAYRARQKYGLDGRGVVVGIWDGGKVYPHAEFGNRLTIAENGNYSEHSTHVAGTIAAAGLFVTAQGHAPAAEIISYNYNGDLIREAQRAVRKYDVIISNNSWGYMTGWGKVYLGAQFGYVWGWFGDDFFGLYDSEAAAYDKLVRSEGLFIFFAAGNDRGDVVSTDFYWDDIHRRFVYQQITDRDGPFMTVGSPGSAKNVFAIGATNGGKRKTNFSSFGPTRDGRVKPDFTAPGMDILSTMLGNGYGFLSGTSMSSPAAAGGIALLIDKWREEFSGDPPVDLLRAILVVTADDLGRKGPDYKFGFGALNIFQAAQLIDSYGSSAPAAVAIASEGGPVPAVSGVSLTAANNKKSYPIVIGKGVSNVKIALTWLDPPGEPNGGKAVVNELDLRLISPNGKTCYPYKLDKNKPAKKATTGNNNVDVVELVELKNPAAGEWTIQVIAKSIDVGSSQDFSLAVYSK